MSSSSLEKGGSSVKTTTTLTELDLLLMLPRPIFDEVLTILQATPLTDIPSLLRHSSS